MNLKSLLAYQDWKKMKNQSLPASPNLKSPTKIKVVGEKREPNTGGLLNKAKNSLTRNFSPKFLDAVKSGSVGKNLTDTLEKSEYSKPVPFDDKSLSGVRPRDVVRELPGAIDDFAQDTVRGLWRAYIGARELGGTYKKGEYHDTPLGRLGSFGTEREARRDRGESEAKVLAHTALDYADVLSFGVSSKGLKSLKKGADALTKSGFWAPALKNVKNNFAKFDFPIGKTKDGKTLTEVFSHVPEDYDHIAEAIKTKLKASTETASELGSNSIPERITFKAQDLYKEDIETPFPWAKDTKVTIHFVDDAERAGEGFQQMSKQKTPNVDFFLFKEDAENLVKAGPLSGPYLKALLTGDTVLKNENLSTLAHEMTHTPTLFSGKLFPGGASPQVMDKKLEGLLTHLATKAGSPWRRNASLMLKDAGFREEAAYRMYSDTLGEIFSRKAAEISRLPKNKQNAAIESFLKSLEKDPDQALFPLMNPEKGTNYGYNIFDGLYKYLTSDAFKTSRHAQYIDTEMIEYIGKVANHQKERIGDALVSGKNMSDVLKKHGFASAVVQNEKGPGSLYMNKKLTPTKQLSANDTPTLLDAPKQPLVPYKESSPSSNIPPVKSTPHPLVETKSPGKITLKPETKVSKTLDNLKSSKPEAKSSNKIILKPETKVSEKVKLRSSSDNLVKHSYKSFSKGATIFTHPKTGETLRTKAFQILGSKPKDTVSRLSKYLDRDDTWSSSSKIGALRSFITSGGRELRGMGEGGKRLDKALTEMKLKKDQVIGHWKAKYDKAVKGLSKKEMFSAIEILRGKKPKEASFKVYSAAADLRKLLDEVNYVANGVGITAPYRKDYFPQMFKEGAESQYRKEQAIKSLIDSGKAATVKEAESKLKLTLSTRKGRSYGNLEKTRAETIDSKYLVNEAEALEIYLQSAAERISQAATLGAKDQLVTASINSISDPILQAKARKIFNSVVGNVDVGTYDKIVGGFIQFQTVTNLSTAFVKNLTQIANTITEAGLRNTAKATYRYLFTKEGKDLATKANVFDFKTVAKEAGMNQTAKVTEYAMYLFSKTEQLLRGISASAGELKAKQLLSKAGMKDFGDKLTMGEATVVRGLRRLGIRSEHINAKGKLTPEGSIIAANRMSEMTQFKVDAQNTPISWRGTTGRAITQWESFNFRQTRFMVDSVLKEARHGNFMPLARFAVVMPVLTYFTLAGSRLIRGQEQEGMEGEQAYEMGGGFPKSVYDRGKYIYETAQDETKSGFTKTAKITGELLGPSVSKIADTAIAFESIGTQNEKNQKNPNANRDPYLQLKREGAEMIPYVGPALKNTAFAFPDQKYKEKEKLTPLKDAFDIAKSPIAAAQRYFKVEYEPKVARVIDGDTIVLTNGQRVRFLGMNTPESGEKGYEAAKNRLANLVLGKNVDIDFDITTKDSTGTRLVGTVKINGKTVNEIMIEEGLATQMTIPANVGDPARIKMLQDKARAEGKGMWSGKEPRVKLVSEDYGKEPSWWRKLISPELGKDKDKGYYPHLDENKIKAMYKDKSLAEARGVDSKVKEEDLLTMRAVADGYAEYFFGGKKQPSARFDSDTLAGKLRDANEKGNVRTAVANLFADSNYSDKEKESLYENMGFTSDEATRIVLGQVKKKGMADASPFIAEYLQLEKFTPESITQLIEDKTMTEPQAENMFERGLIEANEFSLIMSLLGKTSGGSVKSSSGIKLKKPEVVSVSTKGVSSALNKLKIASKKEFSLPKSTKASTLKFKSSSEAKKLKTSLDIPILKLK